MMSDAIKSFSSQLAFQPEIINGSVPHCATAIVAGMGGSHLAADLVKMCVPDIELTVHADYGLPVSLPSQSAPSLLIASSYSGNTEETLDAFTAAGMRGFPRAAISVGGKLLKQAQEEGVPYIKLPNTGIQPRSALGFMTIALLSLRGKQEEIARIAKLAALLDSAGYEQEGRLIAERIQGKVPVIYSSERNRAIALNWKIKFNETGKIPAFWHTFPELNHNEMTGFDAVPVTQELSKKFVFIFLPDAHDDPRVIKRMELTRELYQDRGLAVETASFREGEIFHKAFASLLTADWAAYYTAKGYNAEPEQVPMVEEFKRKMAG